MPVNFLSLSDVITVPRLVAIFIAFIAISLVVGHYTSSFYYNQLRSKSIRVPIVSVIGWRDHEFVIDTSQRSAGDKDEEFRFMPVDGHIDSVGIRSGMILMKEQGSDTIYFLDSLGGTFWSTAFR
jgi:hypothetical protein